MRHEISLFSQMLRNAQQLSADVSFPLTEGKARTLLAQETLERSKCAQMQTDVNHRASVLTTQAQLAQRQSRSTHKATPLQRICCSESSMTHVTGFVCLQACYTSAEIVNDSGSARCKSSSGRLRGQSVSQVCPPTAAAVIALPVIMFPRFPIQFWKQAVVNCDLPACRVHVQKQWCQYGPKSLLCRLLLTSCPPPCLWWHQ